MKNTICLLMLLAGITETLIAQTTTTGNDKTFDLPADHASRRFRINLGKGNTMQIELSNMEDLNRFSNMDSVIRVFLADLEPLKDSLGDELYSKRIDYTTDSLGRKKIRIQTFRPKGSSFLVKAGDVAALKLEQDTIHFIGDVVYTAKYTARKAFTAKRYYRLSFFVNNLSDLKSYMDGSLNKKIAVLQNDLNSPWSVTRNTGSVYLKAEPSISARQPKGFVAGGNYFNLRISADIQNYKNYFVPSFSLGAGIIISNSHFKRDLVLSWDPNFFFGRNSQAQLKTFRNDFLTLTAGQGGIKDNDPTKESHFLTIISIGYLVKREGDYFEKHTFRFGGGRLSLLGGKTKIEPGMYFTHFFKRVTPALRMIQSF